MNVNQLPEQNQDPIEALPDGEYICGIKKVEKKVSEGSGNTYLKIENVVTDGEYKNRKVWHNVTLVDQSLWVLRNWLMAVGLETLDLPITKGADDKFIIDEEGVFMAISAAVIGSEIKLIGEHVPENKEQGWKSKFEVKEFASAEREQAVWSE